MGARLDEAVKAASKKYDLRIGNLSDSSDILKVEAISTGNMEIDHATGIGGLPRGRITELYGPPSSGKTTTGLQCAVACQKMGLPIAVADYEHALDIEYAVKLGLDVENPNLFYLYQPEYFEQGMNIAKMLVETGELGLLLVDSVAAMVPKAEIDGEIGDRQVALQARLMAQTMRIFTSSLAKHGTAAVFLNHIQSVLDTSFIGKKLAAAGVDRKTTPGGQALKFYSSLRIEYKPIGGKRDKVEDDATGEEMDIISSAKVKAMVTKNKLAPPFRESELRVDFGRGFSNYASAVKVLVAHKRLQMDKGGIYRFTPDNMSPEHGPFNPSKPTVNMWTRGEDDMLELMQRNPEWSAGLVAEATKILEDLRASRNRIETDGIEGAELAGAVDTVPMEGEPQIDTAAAEDAVASGNVDAAQLDALLQPAAPSGLPTNITVRGQ